jgi:hypothetical protein
MVGVRVGDDHLLERRTAKRFLDRLQMPRVARPRIDERRHPSGQQPRPVSGAGHRARIEGVNRDRVHRKILSRA